MTQLTEQQKVTWQELLDTREKLQEQIEELEAARSELSQIMLEKLAEEKINGKVVGKWGISKSVRYSFETTLDEARELGAVKETVDQKTLKTLVLKGIAIPGMKKSEYVTVREVQKTLES